MIDGTKSIYDAFDDVLPESPESEFASKSVPLCAVLVGARSWGIRRDLCRGRSGSVRNWCDIARGSGKALPRWSAVALRSVTRDASESAMDARQSVMVRPSLDFA